MAVRSCRDFVALEPKAERSANLRYQTEAATAVYIEGLAAQGADGYLALVSGGGH
jgi:hypothetical protein